VLGCEVIEATMINLDGKEEINWGMLMRVTGAAWLFLDSLLGDRCAVFDGECTSREGTQRYDAME
jgi:hypothetical protein